MRRRYSHSEVHHADGVVTAMDEEAATSRMKLDVVDAGILQRSTLTDMNR